MFRLEKGEINKEKKEQIPVYFVPSLTAKVDEIVANSEGVYKDRNHYIDLAVREKNKKELKKAKQTCIKCGCTNEKACPGGCYWVEPNKCSACFGG